MTRLLALDTAPPRIQPLCTPCNSAKGAKRTHLL
jgi:hypothetical protein